MAAAVAALEQASRNLDKAPRRIRSLGEFVCELENLSLRLQQKHVYKLHNPELDQQIQSLNSPVERQCPKVSEARSTVLGRSGILEKSSLARQVDSDPLAIFMDGAVEIRFGQWSSRSASNGNNTKYENRLAGKIREFLAKIGFWEKNMNHENSTEDVAYSCCSLLQKALYKKSILILLDDVWEMDIIERFKKLYDNGCKCVVTRRNEAAYETPEEADKLKLSKDD
ncbi:hypothetical protein FNV43_RR06925 [Rhamnella rubrinervis]|uniref:NB-ARC domain-containing protein n=1 Tax=Rhamnella rubrinervis TaxID=2594499 RepID=A0A8K0HEA9_9ROSA|nr:hypothetical protein FNV43_RR06925 [Rhamnella rubrinervis]